ncbi:MAG: hypothetical protein ACNA7G_10135 [Methylobacter sp.]
MIPLANRKILSRFVLFGMVVALYDVILHTVFVFLHLAFEWFELGLEEIIEHVFHTTRQQSQIIVFYLLWFMALCVLYRLWRALPSIVNWFKAQLNQLKAQFLDACSECKSYIKDYWGEQSSLQKVKWVASLSLSLYGLTFFAF